MPDIPGENIGHLPEVDDPAPAGTLPRVLSLYEGFFTGGARILHSDVVKGLQERGYDQSVLSINESVFREATLQPMQGDGSYQVLSKAGVGISSLGRCSDGSPDTTPFDQDEADIYLSKANQADVILTLKEQPIRLVRQLGSARKPVITALHRSDPENQGQALDNLIASVDEGVVKACVCCAQATKEAYHSAGVQESKLKVITNGIDLDRFVVSDARRSATRQELDIPTDAPVVTLAARFDGMKNIPLFALSAARYLRDNPEAHLVMCGAGMTDDNPELMRLLAQTVGTPDGEKPKNLHVLGVRRDMEYVYAASDVVSLTSSHGEAFPLSLIEGMASGAIGVATDVGDTRAILEGRGMITSDDPQDIAKSWQEAYLRRSEFRRAFALDRGQFGRERMIGAYAQLINQIYGHDRDNDQDVDFAQAV